MGERTRGGKERKRVQLEEEETGLGMRTGMERPAESVLPQRTSVAMELRSQKTRLFCVAHPLLRKPFILIELMCIMMIIGRQSSAAVCSGV